MSIMEMTFRSTALGFDTRVLAMLPEPKDLCLESGEPLPVLYLLHGHDDDETAWMRKSSVERHLHYSGYNLLCVMPRMSNFWYTNMQSGHDYFTYVSEELPEIIGKYFHISQKREDTFVAGLSMGGYGAFKLAFTHPERYAAAASFSGALDIASISLDPENPQSSREALAVFGCPFQELAGTPHDLMRLLDDDLSAGKPLPRLYQSVGGDDFLLEGNHTFRDFARKRGVPLDYYEQPGIGHEWDFWDSESKKLIQNWLPIRKVR